MNMNTYKTYRAKGYNAKSALHLARCEHFADYGLGDYYAFVQNEQVVEVDDLPNGYEIKLQCFYEDCGETPWEYGESYGEVETYKGELGNGRVELYCGGRNQNYAYGWQEAIKKMRKEFAKDTKVGKAQKEDEILERVRSEYKYFRDYCRDDWSYIWIKGTLFFEGEEVSEESIGLVESSSWGDCAGEIIRQLVRDSKAKVYAGSTVGCV
jgi:hypothetical protein